MAAHSNRGFRRVVAFVPVLALATSVVMPGLAAPASWHRTGSMHVARAAHTATLLPGGRVLVAGGSTPLHNTTESAPTATAEIFDPKTGKWTLTPKMTTPRITHTQTLLPDGRVLVAGGGIDANAQPNDTAEVYDPKTGRWHLTGRMTTWRGDATATLLQDGRVLLAGGYPSPYSSSVRGVDTAELFDPGTETWTPTGRMTFGQVFALAARLPDGRVLVAGGFDAEGHRRASAEIFDPATGTWNLTGSMAVARAAASSVVLPNEQILVVGGAATNPGRPLRSAEVYDPTTGRWHRVASIPGMDAVDTATVIPGGKVLVTETSGQGGTSAIYDIATNRWRTGPKMKAERDGAETATRLRSGRVLVAGGSNNDNFALRSAEIYP